MSEHGGFLDLIERVRAGDNEAVGELFQTYEPVLRRIIRTRLAGSQVRRLVDADDICQSVFGSFFVRMALGQYAIQSQDDLLKLLATMVRNKIVNKQRRQSVESQPELRVPLCQLTAEARTSPTGSPSETVAYEELVCKAQHLLSPAEHELIDLRKQGLAWNDIAARLGSSAEALRKRLARAVDLVVQQLGLDEACRDAN